MTDSESKKHQENLIAQQANAAQQWSQDKQNKEDGRQQEAAEEAQENSQQGADRTTPSLEPWGGRFRDHAKKTADARRELANKTNEYNEQ